MSKKNRNQKQQSRSSLTGPNGDLSVNAVTLFIESKVDEGVKKLQKKFWPYTLIILVLGAIGIWGLFKGITDEIQKQLTSVYVANALEDHIKKFTDDKVANVADGRISIAEKRIIDGFEKKVSEQEAKLTSSSAAAELQIQTLRSALDVMKKAYDARGGDRHAFDEIAVLATNKTEAGEIAAKVIREIEAAYSIRKEKENAPFLGGTRRTVSYNGTDGRHGPISFSDATQIIISHYRDFEEGAINRLVDSGRKEFVEVLMYAVMESSSLDAVYIALRGVEKLAGASFPILGISQARKWWEDNSSNEELHSDYAFAWRVLLRDGLKPMQGESDSDYYKRIVIPLHNAIVAKPDLQTIATAILPVAFTYGLQLRGKIDGVDSLKITKDLISHLPNDDESMRMAFHYNLNTMALYESADATSLFNFAIRVIKPHRSCLEVLKANENFTSEFKKLVEVTVSQLDERTKNISFLCVMNILPTGETQYITPIMDGADTLHKLDLVAKKDLTFVVHSHNDIEIKSGELGCIPFKTKGKDGEIIILNDKGIPALFDVQLNKSTE